MGSDPSRRRLRWPLFAAAGWMLLVVTAGFALELPNNRPIRRGDLWPLVLGLVDYLDPNATRFDESGRPLPDNGLSGWKYFPQRFDLLAVAGTILVGGYCAGSLGLRALRLSNAYTELERFVFACGAGLSLMSLATLLAGLAGALSRPLLLSLLGLCTLAELVLAVRAWRSSVSGDGGSSVSGDASNAARPGRWGVFAALAVSAPFLLSMLLGALLPSVDFDVNEYHFLGPKEYFQQGRITFLPHNVYTSFPFGTEMLTLLAMVVRGDWYRGALAGKCVLMAFEPLTALALYAAGRRWFGASAGLFAAVLYLTTPWTYRIATTAYAEGGLTFYLFTALYATLAAAERSRPGSSAMGPGPDWTIDRAAAPMASWLLAGFLAGSAMACKYPGMISVVIPLFAVVVCRTWRLAERLPSWRFSTHRSDRVECLSPGPPFSGGGDFDSSSAPTLRGYWLILVLFGAGVLAAVGPWLIKNLFETGNPVYPLMYTVFGGADWDSVLNAKWRRGHQPGSFAPLTLVDLAVDIAVRNDWVSPLLFAFVPLAWFDRASRGIVNRLGLYLGWLFATTWLLTHRIDRFWVPLLPVAALLAGAGAGWCYSRALRGAAGLALRTLAVACLAVVTPFLLAINLSELGGYNAYLLDLDRARAVAAGLTAPEVVYLNEHLPAGSQVLSVGDAELFEARFPVVYNTVFDRSILEAWCGGESAAAADEGRSLDDAESIRARLANEGITHVYVNWLEILRYRAPGSYGYTEFVTPGRFAELQRAGILGPAWRIDAARTEVDRLNPAWQEELRRFAPQLISTAGGVDQMTTFDVFPVTVGKNESDQ